MNSVKVQGERWFPSEQTFADEMKELWGEWYCDSEVGKLRAVLMHKPGMEVEGITEENFHSYRFRAPMNADRVRQQHDALADVYRNHGVEVHYVQEQRTDKPNAIFARDLVFMTPEGAIVCRPAIPARRGEERAVAATLAALGVPIIKTINGNGYFEGASAMWIDRETVVIGTGSRTNESGASQVEAELRNIGVKNIIRTEIPYGCIHLDSHMSMVDKRKMLIFPWYVSYDCAKQLLDCGVELIEVTNIHEVEQGMCLNFVALEPGKIVTSTGNPETKGLLEKNGIEVTEVLLDEVMNGWGAVHCVTAFLKRDPIGS
ncbi:N-Dimethylarginine dimethylaminohydrolase [Evansella caseinilytica]|uniref:N-Dimethylarginine dimethylaminohydrolase n=1 Tax=Evansella caseinilytica TaxID=1503961 RepID=A0A1H3RC23_9BACI|nr:arginine deiminase family protein [Evansella caseinilytica]SDZ22811.1 N-Dimethylarginine dimethylaminohydrolase [Evansella caseinilytica]